MHHSLLSLFLFTHPMHLACLSMPCILPVYPCHMTAVCPCHVRCLFTHAMHLACLSMPCILPVYPWHDIACLSMPCTLPVYPCHVRCLFIHAMYVACLSMPYMIWLFIHAICVFSCSEYGGIGNSGASGIYFSS